MSISLIFANVGTGKTTYLAKLANDKRNKKKYDKIYANVPIKGTYQFNVKEWGKKQFENCLMLVDEGAIELDNNSKLNEDQKYFLRMHRHYNVDIVVISQSWEDVHIVVRRLYSRVYIMKRSIIPNMSYMKLIKKKVDCDEDTHQIIDWYGYVPFPFSLMFTRYFFRPLYYKYFDSWDARQLEPHEPKLWYEPVNKKQIETKVIDFVGEIEGVKDEDVKCDIV